MIHFNSSQNSGLDLGIGDGNIAMLQWDQEKSKLNYCSADFFDQLFKMLVSLQKREDLKGLIFTSSKDDCFFCDYHWAEFRSGNNNPDYESKLLKTASDCLNLLEAMPFPTVVIINGPCVGSGFEFILAFDYRIGCNNLITTFSLPGINMGLAPVLGTASRLPRICGIDNAFEMIAHGLAYSSSAMIQKNILQVIIHFNIQVVLDYLNGPKQIEILKMKILCFGMYLAQTTFPELKTGLLCLLKELVFI